MYYIKFKSAASLIIVVMLLIPVRAQFRTVGLFLNDSSSFNGYTLFAPLSYINTYIINNEGRLIHLWEGSNKPGLSAYLLENGNLLRTAVVTNTTFNAGGKGGLIQEFEWEEDLIWEFEYSSDQYLQHHDVEKLPNGNVLLIAWEFKTFEETLSEGRDPDLLLQNELWPDHIIEVQPDGSGGANIVWEWHVWDHLIQDFDSTEFNYGVISDHPELIDINFVGTTPIPSGADWNHVNAVDFNETFDQIIISAHHFSEIWVIDHSTTTEEAAGHTGGNSGMGGDLLYRWGNPQTYDTGDEADQKLFGQHDSHWVEPGLPGEGNILIFNNGRNRPAGDYSTIEEIITPVDQDGNYAKSPGSPYGPDIPVWTYTDSNPTDFYAPNVSGSQRQPNGNTLICSGPTGNFFEVTNEGEIVWLYVNPVISTGPIFYEDPIPGIQNWVFRAYRYAPDYPGFDGRDLTPGDPIELYPTDVDETDTELFPEKFALLQNNPNPFNPTTTITYTIPQYAFINLVVYDVLGKTITSLVNEQKTAGSYKVTFDASSLPSGSYFYRLSAGNYIFIKKMMLVK